MIKLDGDEVFIGFIIVVLAALLPLWLPFLVIGKVAKKLGFKL